MLFCTGVRVAISNGSSVLINVGPKTIAMFWICILFTSLCSVTLGGEGGRGGEGGGGEGRGGDLCG